MYTNNIIIYFVRNGDSIGCELDYIFIDKKFSEMTNNILVLIFKIMKYKYKFASYFWSYLILCMYLDYNLLGNIINNLKSVFQNMWHKNLMFWNTDLFIFIVLLVCQFMFTLSKNTYIGLEMALVVHSYSLLYPSTICSA